ncbi:MAG: hypothetical protein GQ574_15230 [Crocinitomix sp.]|nr:hypothetical protein [Crocinitomix sp.]
MAQNPESNKTIALYFYIIAFNGDPSAALEYFASDTFKINNPLIGSTKTSFISYFDGLETSYPDRTLTIDRTIASNDVVSIQTSQTWSSGAKYKTLSFFKFNDSGEIKAYWDKRSTIN